MVLCAIPPGVTLFGIGLVVAGFGVGFGAIDHRAGTRVLRAAAAQCEYRGGLDGIGIGGAARAVVAATVVPAFGFRSEFLVGGLAALVILPLAVAFLPESLAHLRAPGARPTPGGGPRLGVDPEPGPEPEPTGPAVAGRFTALFAGGRALMNALFWRVATGPLLVGLVADRVGSKVGTAGSFLLAVVGIAVLSHRLPRPLQVLSSAFAVPAVIGAVLVAVMLTRRTAADAKQFLFVAELRERPATGRYERGRGHEDSGDRSR
jgi:AAHS family benzoate transporter-like MFS transporter